MSQSNYPSSAAAAPSAAGSQVSRSQQQGSSAPSSSSQYTGGSGAQSGVARYWHQQQPGVSPVFVRRPRAIVFDILGTASKSGFLERILFPYLKVNLEPYINTHWARKDFAKLYARIQEQSVDFNRTDPNCPLVALHERPEAKQSLFNFLNYVTEVGVNSAPVTQLRFKVWFEGYQSSRLKTPIYSDVPNRIRVWFAEGIKFYVFSNTWVEAQQALLKNTNHGDLTNLITGHYDNDFGLLTSTDSWRRLCMAIKQSPNDVLFLTKSIQEAQAAQESGICVVLVLTHRHNVRGISHEDRQRFPYVRTLNDLQWIEGSMMPQASSGTSALETQRTQLADSASGPQGASAVPTAATVVAASAHTAQRSSSLSKKQAPTGGASGAGGGSSNQYSH